MPVNHIIAQDPPENRRVRTGRSVFVVVSLGLEYVSVPDIIGLSLNEARNRLVQAGLTTGTVREEEHPDSPPGTVLRQTPAGGSRLEKGAAVDLVVTQTRQQEDVEVPNLRGLTLDEAGSRLAELGLQIGKTYAEEPTAGTVPGTIIDQNPPPGTVVEPGSSVDFVYAEKEGPLTGGLLRLPSTPRETTVNRDVMVRKTTK